MELELKQFKAHPSRFSSGTFLSKTAFGMTVDLPELTQIPAEILGIIAQDFPPHDVGGLSNTCRSLRHVASSNELAVQLYAQHNYDAITIAFRAGIRVMAIYVALFRQRRA